MLQLQDNFAGLGVVRTYKPVINSCEYPTLDTRPSNSDVPRAFVFSARI